jgi:DNA-binding response OmpR family regulator
MDPDRILLVEDDAALAGLLSGFLRSNGFEVLVEESGSEGQAAIVARQPSLVILDVGLPDKDGFTVCREVRPRYGGPILMLTARGDARSEVEGLDRGADDYLAKPVKPRVLLARVRAALRRSGQRAPAQERLRVGDLDLAAAEHLCTVRGAPLELPLAEFELLWLLASSPGKVLDRALLLARLRASDYDGIDRSIDLRVSRLRQKLAAAGSGCSIRAVRGVGYALEG